MTRSPDDEIADCICEGTGYADRVWRGHLPKESGPICTTCNGFGFVELRPTGEDSPANSQPERTAA